jgi:hypothetical protein
LIEYWLGRAYLKSGYEETALRVWQPLLDAPDLPPFLKAKADSLRGSRAIPSGAEAYDFVEVERFEGRVGRQSIFERPSTIIPRPDGSLFLVAHGSDELVTLDSSGVGIEADSPASIGPMGRPSCPTARSSSPSSTAIAWRESRRTEARRLSAGRGGRRTA